MHRSGSSNSLANGDLDGGSGVGLGRGGWRGSHKVAVAKAVVVPVYSSVADATEAF